MKQGIKRKDEQELSGLPWNIAVTVYGDHKIEANSYNRMGDRKKEDEEKAEERWPGGCHFESPEAACLRKEMIREALENLTQMQKEAKILYESGICRPWAESSVGRQYISLVWVDLVLGAVHPDQCPLMETGAKKQHGCDPAYYCKRNH